MREASAASWGEQELAEITAAFMFAVITAGNVGQGGGWVGGGSRRGGGRMHVAAALLQILQGVYSSLLFCEIIITGRAEHIC